MKKPWIGVTANDMRLHCQQCGGELVVYAPGIPLDRVKKVQKRFARKHDHAGEERKPYAGFEHSP